MHKIRLYGLAFGCPFGTTLHNCALWELHTLENIHLKINYIENLPHQKAVKLHTMHQRCVCLREKKLVR